MGKKLAVIMDAISGINPVKDSTLAILLAAQKRGWDLLYLEMQDVWYEDGTIFCRGRELTVFDDTSAWFSLGREVRTPLKSVDVTFMRKDPPFNMEYVYMTYLLEHVEQEGVLVVNKPRSLRDANEKLFATRFRQCCPSTLVSRDAQVLRNFISAHSAIVLKPLGGMGGASVFKLTSRDVNVSVAIETLTENGTQFAMAQRFIPEISAGDKRILMIDGEPVPYALARVPAKGELRGNLAAGGTGVGVELTDRDRWICEQVGPTLKEMGLIFVGLDVIGDYLTEINVTSPTCIRELDACFGLDIAGQLMDVIEEKLKARGRA